MLLIFKATIGISLLFTAVSASAQNKVGNGGNVVYCKKAAPDKNTAELLDFYENNIHLASAEANPHAIAQKQLEELKLIAPQLAEQYIKRLSEIDGEIDLKSDVLLTPIPDSYHLFKPLEANCEILQTAIRRAQIVSSEKRFLIRQDLWNQMAPLQKAGLLTHEIIYEHLAKLGEENSIKVRKLNAFLYSKNSKKEDFWNLVKELEVPIYPR
jgi:hypothetical protein